MSRQGCWRFRRFELVPAERRLIRNGRAIHIQPKAFDVLLALVAKAGEVVSREFLLSQVWGGTHIGDANLTNNISELRSLLGRDAIETIPKFGYRFRLEITGRPGISGIAADLLSRGKAQMDRRTTECVAAAQNLFWQAIAEEPECAEAWAWLGRASRYLEKFQVGPEHNRKLAEAAFRRAFTLDADLPSAHQFYTTYQADRGEAAAAMIRLLQRIARFPDDAPSYAGLVLVCRFNGLLEASLAAHERAVQAAPAITTSVPHTYFALGDYRTVIESYAANGRLTRGYLDVAAWACVGTAREVAPRISERLAGGEWPPLFRALLRSLLAAVQSDADAARAIARPQELADDPESALYFARHLAWCGCRAEAVQFLRQSVQAGLAIPSMMERDPWLRPLRQDAAFRALRREAADRHERAKALFHAAGGTRLLTITRRLPHGAGRLAPPGAEPAY